MENSDSDKIKLYVINEHNEAIYLWTQNVLRNNMKNVTLLHIDPHDDLTVPLAIDKSVLRDVRSLKKYSKKLTIGNFIIPSMLSANFRKIFHVVPANWNFIATKGVNDILMKLLGRRYLTFSSEKNLLFFSSNFDSFLSVIYKKITHKILNLDFKHISFFFETIPYKKIPRIQNNLILDIDLDFFVENVPIYSIEISKAIYNNFQKKFKKYFTNIFVNFKLKKSGKKYFILFNNTNNSITDTEIIKSNLLPKLTKKTIKKNIYELCEILKERDKPDFITICRSCYSEFSNKKLLSFAEAELLKKIREIYNVKIIYIDN